MRNLPPQLPRADLLDLVPLHYLRRRHLEVHLRHVRPPLSDREHPGLGAGRLDLGARAVHHLLCHAEQVQPTLHVHVLRVDL